MSVVLILSDTVTSEQRAEIIRVIQQYGEWATLSESSYAVHTRLSPEQLSEKLKNRVGIGDGVKALRVSRSNRATTPKKARTWLDGGIADPLTKSSRRMPSEDHN